jgi:rod shape-determining protein MreC
MCQNQKSRHSNIVFVVLLLIGFSFIIVDKFSVSINFIKNFIYYIAYPNVSAANHIFRYSGDFYDNIKAMICAQQENVALKQKIQELTDKLRNYDAMSLEYENLSKLLKIEKLNNTISVFAKISARDSCKWYQWLIIDKGANDGLYNDLPVTMFNKDDNTLHAMGKIIETYETSSKVMLITNSAYTLPVEIKNKGINCLAEGSNSKSLKITYIPKDADIEQGDEVVVSQLSSDYQKGMPVGIIKDIIKKDAIDKTSMYFQAARAEVFFDSSHLYCAVVLVPEGMFGK